MKIRAGRLAVVDLSKRSLPELRRRASLDRPLQLLNLHQHRKKIKLLSRRSPSPIHVYIQAVNLRYSHFRSAELVRAVSALAVVANFGIGKSTIVPIRA